MNLEDKQLGSNPLIGTVIAVQANYYQVRLDLEQQERLPLLLCTRRAMLKKMGQKVMVGDRVEVVEPDWAGERGAISHVLPRHTELDRPPVANAQQILLVFALEEPKLEPYQLSRFLIKAETTGLEVRLYLNKSDLLTPEQLLHWQLRLRQWGYDPVFISVHLATIEQIRAQLNNKITVVAGPSGVGKSSLINYLIPTANLRTSEVSGKLGRGRHTTRHVELFQLPSGGLLADTPGFNQPDLDCEPEELVNYFPEARERLAVGHCQFNDCSHRDEPNCVVRGDWERYEHYLEFLAEAIIRATLQGRNSNLEANMKLKSKRGKTQYEPKLETKKYRRPSRRSQQQGLQKLDEDGEAQS